MPSRTASMPPAWMPSRPSARVDATDVDAEPYRQRRGSSSAAIPCSPPRWTLSRTGLSSPPPSMPSSPSASRVRDLLASPANPPTLAGQRCTDRCTPIVHAQNHTPETKNPAGFTDRIYGAGEVEFYNS